MNFSVLYLLLSIVHVSLIQAQALGPAQVCRCYSPDTPNVCPPSAGSKLSASDSSAQCQTPLKVDISFVADDGVSLYICGIKVRQSSNFDEIQTFTYDANCDDFMLEVNNKGLSAGVALLATFNGQKYGTNDMSGKFGVSGTLPLFAISTFQPQGLWFMNPPGFDFSSWTPAVVVESILGIGQNFNFLASQGAFPINVQSGDVSPGIYGLKLSVPFCQ